jgi:hypothetical protein
MGLPMDLRRPLPHAWLEYIKEEGRKSYEVFRKKGSNVAAKNNPLSDERGVWTRMVAGDPAVFGTRGLGKRHLPGLLSGLDFMLGFALLASICYSLFFQKKGRNFKII